MTFLAKLNERTENVSSPNCFCSKGHTKSSLFESIHKTNIIIILKH